MLLRGVVWSKALKNCRSRCCPKDASSLRMPLPPHAQVDHFLATPMPGLALQRTYLWLLCRAVPLSRSRRVCLPREFLFRSSWWCLHLRRPDKQVRAPDLCDRCCRPGLEGLVFLALLDMHDPSPTLRFVRMFCYCHWELTRKEAVTLTRHLSPTPARIFVYPGPRSLFPDISKVYFVNEGESGTLGVGTITDNVNVIGFSQTNDVRPSRRLLDRLSAKNCVVRGFSENRSDIAGTQSLTYTYLRTFLRPSLPWCTFFRWSTWSLAAHPTVVNGFKSSQLRGRRCRRCSAYNLGR